MSADEVQRLKSLLSVLEERLKCKEELLKGKDEQLKGKEEQLKGKEEQLKGKEEQLKGKDDLINAKEDALKAFQSYSLEMSGLVKDVFLKELAGVKFELDVAKKAMHARGVFEACVEELWTDACLARQLARAPTPGCPSSLQTQPRTNGDKC
jgi:chromosome segregation ATPase